MVFDRAGGVVAFRLYYAKRSTLVWAKLEAKEGGSVSCSV